MNRSRRQFVQRALAAAASLAPAGAAFALARPPADAELASVLAQVPATKAETIKLIQEWIALPSIAAENLNYPAGPEYMAKLAREAGFTHVEVVPTSGKGGVFATLDAGAARWVAVYFMYDVKQF